MMALLAVSCTDNVVDNSEPEADENDITGQMVLFSAGNAENITTRASIPYMEEGGRFVCRMYYRSKIGDTEESPYDVELTNEDDSNCHGTQVTAWLKVNNTVGNCIYWNKEYEPSGNVNTYGEIGATAFYWQNRLTHAFLALTDYNQLKTNTASTGLTMPNDTHKTIESKETQRVYSIRKYKLNNGTTVLSSGDIVVTEGSITEEQATSDTEFMNDPEKEKSGDEYYDATDGYWYQNSKWLYKTLENGGKAIYCVIWRVTAEKIKTKYYYKTYDLTKGTKTSMSEQPDPIQALTLMRPAGATQETNRVKLYFKHQFSQIQVNIRPSQDANDKKVEASQIQSIELLGVTKQGNVYVQLNDDGTVHPTDFEPVNKKTIPEAEWKEPYGTEFLMFDRTSQLSSNEKAQGYFVSKEAIAFGRLEGIRLVWKENTTNVEHKIIFQIPSEDLKTLQSGYRYIYNMELRRGTLALIRTVIKDWVVDETDYSTDGTIKPTTGN